MSDWESLQSQTAQLLDEAFALSQEKFFRGSPMREMLEYHYRSGGKRLRPALVLGAALAYARTKGGNPETLVRACVPYALAVELLHNATLIHDDIQDGDQSRRGQPTLWVKYSEAQAINCGDAWFFVPQLLIQDADYPADTKLALLELVQSRILAVIEGQSQEFALKERFSKGEEISIPHYLSMVEGKTSALFSVPLVGGAMIAGASVLERKALEQSATSLGRAFQIQDDLLDLWGSKGREQVGSDIAEGKLSYPLVLLLNKLHRGSQDRSKAEAIVRAPREETTNDQIAWLISLMEREGIKEKAKQDFRHHLKEARTGSLWTEVIDYLAGWLEEKVAGF
ncbi:MAG TPA: polyprenyl synthetase family protein [Bdellovibrionota bacterium]|jgi:geranylgeranyl pyrophosphate synthase